MADVVFFQIHSKLARVLGETYRTSEHALKELVDNAWDAEASNVRITMPSPMSGDAIIIEDDGNGMTTEEVRSEYLAIALDRATRRGEKTPTKARRVKGRRGVGKFAGLMVAQSMQVTTCARGNTTTITLEKTQILDSGPHLGSIPIAVDSSKAKKGTNTGTTVRLTSLNQSLRYPSEQRLRELLVREYGRCVDFVIEVNGKRLQPSDVEGSTYLFEADLPEAGHVDLRFTITERALPKAFSGIVVRVADKIVGQPTMFELEESEDVPGSLLRRVHGELNADGLERRSVRIVSNYGEMAI